MYRCMHRNGNLFFHYSFYTVKLPIFRSTWMQDITKLRVRKIQSTSSQMLMFKLELKPNPHGRCSQKLCYRGQNSNKRSLRSQNSNNACGQLSTICRLETLKIVCLIGYSIVQSEFYNSCQTDNKMLCFCVFFKLPSAIIRVYFKLAGLLIHSWRTDDKYAQRVK